MELDRRQNIAAPVAHAGYRTGEQGLPRARVEKAALNLGGEGPLLSHGDGDVGGGDGDGDGGGGGGGGGGSAAGNHAAVAAAGPVGLGNPVLGGSGRLACNKVKALS